MPSQTPTPPETTMPSEITWSAPATTPPLSEDEIKDIRQTLRLLHDLLHRTTTPTSRNHINEEETLKDDDNNINNDIPAKEVLDTTNTLAAAGIGEKGPRKRDKAKRILQTHGPRIVGAATAIGLGVLNLVTSIT
ncbi:hypothetical protein M409DRAFT_60910 [Zasmidium cellare ATCC 36951]|uniref:Uncharacterized protein n=1 Tax=Zasmidium cellare ATCC 36951 TaxID=1080233 RepID=A0A6A6BX18_ZASCE|nr:uncharacterized protein M409DRAFT_60910 [Zasmidium cellare ATCC 36951]KAF2159327.1 hypothetical protein M409DRAFT_60910 [Zasmidium cellare ATCC 36951]